MVFAWLFSPVSSGSSSSLIVIEIGHAAERDLGGQIGANIFASGCRHGRGTRAQVNVDGANLVFVVAPGSWKGRNEELIHRGGRSAIRKIVRELEILEGLSDRLWCVEVHRTHEHGMLGIGGGVQKVGDHPDAGARCRRIGAVGYARGKVLEGQDRSGSFQSGSPI